MAFDFNPQKISEALAREFTIINKDKIEVPFEVNLAQDHFLNNMTLKTLVLKARKLGFSSVILGIETLLFLFGRNERLVSMSFDAGASSRQLERAKHYIKSFEYKNNLSIPFKYNSKSELVYEGIDKETQKTYRNTMRIGTAKSDSFGRGDDITFLHLTEVAFAPDLEALLSGVAEAVVNDAPTLLETTANGHNDLKKFWDLSVLGETGYTPLFYGPDWEYSKEFLEQKKKSLREKYPQEYPSTPEEAFIASGSPYFDKEALRAYQLKQKNYNV